ncbi:hypothetical protein SCCGRSA3_02057 [Marine Group I thaumarchaeote SCGC RSA3]|uniref:MG2 domain protein n=5 Tax=Marine Group I TaxID=905826 RepID=A0A081RNY7_9ARCH|nr:hypothetical protein AAA799N04_00580 [Marine Group I thaumarchaeote SCGC AAA799-N04]KFM15667.1 hypothetical protein AAA799D11_01109 [Marine Group I thaumarchaeote SCGC AAA799-D11]KFM16808.1 hypothetical protein SCCGRSA3_02057 [Marine Group I thaumarchaeote SCGC RSA3]
MKPVFLFLFSVLFVSLLSSTALGVIDSPRKQMANGVPAEEVICKNKLQLMIRSNGDAICAKLSSVEKWISSKNAVVIETAIKDSDNHSKEEQMDVDISPEKILVKSARDTYALGTSMAFTGEVMPNTDLEISLEDSKGDTVYVDILEVDDSGHVRFEITTDDTFTEGAYFLILKQGEDSEIVPIQIGEASGDIAAVIEKFHYDLNSKASVEIFGPSSSDISLAVFDSRNDVRFEETIPLDSTGYAEYLIELSGYKKGNYYLVLNHASEETIEEFTVGLGVGIDPIEIIIDDNYYNLGETVFLIGKSSDMTQILIELFDPTGEIIDVVEYYTDRDGKFSYPLEIPLGKQSGLWTVKVSNGERISEVTFEVVTDDKILTIQVDKDEPYIQGEFVIISGTGITSESQALIQIKSVDELYEIIPEVTKEGTFSEAWQIPDTGGSESYTVMIVDGDDKATTDFQVTYYAS